MVEALKPSRGGFLRVIGCGQFVKAFLLGDGPLGSPTIDPNVGAPQSLIFRSYKLALMRATALDQATRAEERQARLEKRSIDPDNIERLTQQILERMPYRTRGARFHSFVVYVSTIQRLGWIQPTGHEEPSAFQHHHAPGPPRRYFRLTEAGRAAGDAAWRNPHRALYG
ncbi:MAG: hypothetical protein ACNA7X_02450 [Dehalococcoidia bacterium]